MIAACSLRSVFGFLRPHSAEVLGLLIAISSTGSIAPAHSGLTACEGPEAHASDAEIGDEFGQAVALDADTFAIGAPATSASNPTPEPGTVYVFRDTAGTITQEARLVPSDGVAGQGFGGSVALNGDLLVAGTKFSATYGVYVFTRSGITWTQQQKLVTPDPTNAAQFGAALVISGNTLAVSDPGYRDAGGVLRGAVYIYTLQSGSWTLHARILGAGARWFGWSLALQADTLVVGAVAASNPFPTSGHAFVYRRDTLNAWNLEGTLSPTSVSARSFGWDVALDGDVAVVGDPSPSLGEAWVFTRTAAVWTETVELIGSPPVGSQFGESVELKGARIAVGDGTAPASVGHFGRVWIFDRSGAAWIEAATIESSETGYLANFGRHLAFDGMQLIVGEGSDDDFGPDSGSAWTYLVTDAPSTYCTAKLNSHGCTPSISFTGLPASGGADDFFIGAGNVLNNKPGVMVWGLSSAAVPFFGGTLCLQAPLTRAPIQFAHGTPPPVVDCSGAYSFHFSHAYMTAHSLVPGAQVFAQYWSRDQGFAAPNNIGLTNALSFVICL